MQERDSSRLWFSPDYKPELTNSSSLNKNIENQASATLAADEIVALQDGIEEKLPSTDVGEKALKILIWSNSESEAQYIAQELTRFGYANLSYVTSHEEGLKKMTSQRYDFFIIDLMIDGMGARLVEALRSSNTYRNTPMLVCTESELMQDMLGAMAAGANDLVCKPINTGLLQKKIALHSKVVPEA